MNDAHEELEAAVRTQLSKYRTAVLKRRNLRGRHAVHPDYDRRHAQLTREIEALETDIVNLALQGPTFD